MPLVWNKDLEIGIPEIDMQHRRIFTWMNALLEQMREGKGKYEVARFLGHLGRYTEEHFATEERCMRRYGYANIALHMQLHDDFRAVLDHLQARLKKEGASTSLALETQKVMHEWWRSHITEKDTVLAGFLREKIAEEQKKSGLSLPQLPVTSGQAP